MAYEIAIVLSYLGTAFILIYLSSMFSEGQKFLKLFLFSIALLLLVVNSNSTYTLIQAQNTTLENTTQQILENRADNSFYILIVSFGFLIFYAFVMAFLEVTKLFRTPPKW